MNRSNVAALSTARRSLKGRAVSAFKKASAAVAMSAVSLSAMAQDAPASVDGAAEFMQTKGGIAIAVAAAITLILLGITAAKLPRRGS